MVAFAGALRLSAAVIDEVRKRVETSYPREACGFLLGRGEGSEWLADRLVAAENRAARADRFYIDAADVFAAQQAARRHGDEVVAVYHSHPDAPAEPSETDRRDADGEWIHLIVACNQGVAAQIECWRWDGEGFLPIGLQVQR